MCFAIYEHPFEPRILFSPTKIKKTPVRVLSYEERVKRAMSYLGYIPKLPTGPVVPTPNYLKYLHKREEGTTSLGFIFNSEGIMVAVDHSSISSSSFPENVGLLTSHMLAVISGGNEVLRNIYLGYLKDMCRDLEKKGNKASAAVASKWLAGFLSRHPFSDDRFSLGILIAGWDNESGPGLYKVDAKGKELKESMLGTGSGSDARSIFLIRSLDKMSVAEAAQFAKSALCTGVRIAPESRECVSVFHVGSAGVTPVVSNHDIAEAQKQLRRAQNRAPM